MPPVPEPPDNKHIETRLLLVAEMLDRAVEEVRRAMDEIRNKETFGRHAELPGPAEGMSSGQPADPCDEEQ